MDIAPVQNAPVSTRWFRWAVAFVWLATGCLVLHPHYRAVGNAYLGRLGFPAWLMFATCVMEILLGCYVALKPANRWITVVQIVLIAGFTSILAIQEPLLLASPFGVLTKNVPLLVLIVGAWRLPREGWTTRNQWLLRLGMAVIWITEGLFPKFLFQQQVELDIVERFIPLPIESRFSLAIIGVLQILVGVLGLVTRGRLLSAILAVQLAALVVLPILVSLHDPLLWVHPFGPLTKNVPIFVGTLVVFLHHTPFLTAQWSHVLLFTFAVPKGLVAHHLPGQVEIDGQKESALLSLVSLDFSGTRVLGIPWPGLRDFVGVNLRIYARHGERTGVVFVRELAPSFFIAWIARTLYREPMVSVPVHSRLTETSDHICIEREFELGGRKHFLGARARKTTVCLPIDDEAHFVKERAWGFRRNPWGELTAYRVEHPVWNVYPIESWQLDIDWAAAYGASWAVLQDADPISVVLAEGSYVRLWFPV